MASTTATSSVLNALTQCALGAHCMSVSSALDSPETRQALQVAKDLYEKAMTSEVLSWDDSANNQYMQSGKGSWIYNPISVYRTIEGQNPELFKNIEAGQFDIASDDYRTITGRPPRTLEQFLADVKAAREAA